MRALLQWARAVHKMSRAFNGAASEIWISFQAANIASSRDHQTCGFLLILIEIPAPWGFGDKMFRSALWAWEWPEDGRWAPLTTRRDAWARGELGLDWPRLARLRRPACHAHSRDFRRGLGQTISWRHAPFLWSRLVLCRSG